MQSHKESLLKRNHTAAAGTDDNNKSLSFADNRSDAESTTTTTTTTTTNNNNNNNNSEFGFILGMILKTRKQFLIFLGAIGVLSVVSIIVLAIGVYKYSSVEEVCGSGDKPNRDRIKLENILNEVKSDYYTIYPNEIYADPGVELVEIVDKYIPYDPNWETLKSRTDHAIKLQQKLKDLNIDKSNLRPREKKAYAQLDHYLGSIFGNPYDENYYAGDWMLGPNHFCWQQICYAPQSLGYHFNADQGFIPRNVTDVEKIIKSIRKLKKTYRVYQDNMVLGVKAGMVRSVEDCNSGRDAFSSKFKNIVREGPKGVLKEPFVKHLINPAYYDTVKDGELFDMTKAVTVALVEYLGSPLHDFINFLKNNHTRHCVPADVASGLANLPLRRVWLDQKETDIKTTRTLPTGERLNGTKTYEMILPYFTTTDQYDAISINALGESQKNKLYTQALEIARKIMGKDINQTEEAVKEFKADLNHPRHFFNTTPIPDEENGALGGSRCPDMESAKKNCSVRYEAMQKWFSYTREIIAMLDPLTVNLFHMGGERITTPVCPVKMVAKFNPSSGSQSYSGGGPDCNYASEYKLPFFLKLPGPKYNAFSVGGHETRPGHHTQVQGFNEYFSSSGSNDVIDWLNTVTYYTAFTEGWALYAENPLLAKETDLYKDEPYQEYGMLKWQIWRALRLVIDTGLHSRGLTMNEALELFEEFAWDTTDKAYKDTIRYMSDPGQATAYMIGQLAIWKIRNETEQLFREHGIRFDVKEFHYLILSQGSSPLQYLTSYMKDYQQCKINPDSRADCPEILDPKKANKPNMKFKGFGTAKRWKHIRRVVSQRREQYE